MTASAPAKLNLGLHVLARRADGYHDLETVFVPLAWADTLTFARSDAITLTCSDDALPTDDTNLVLRAARALARHAGTEAGAAIHLDKAIPHGAGLGGGSSDAAATLRALCDLWRLDVPDADLYALARSLGADVPFFLDPAPTFATGRGDRLAPLAGVDGDPYALPFPVVVAVPDVRVATAEAYRLVTPRADGRPDLAALVRSNDPARWRRELVNDFEAPVVTLHPPVRAVRQALVDAGAVYVSLTGSGSAFFGLFDDDAAALAAAEALRYAGVRVWHGTMEAEG